MHDRFIDTNKDDLVSFSIDTDFSDIQSELEHIDELAQEELKLPLPKEVVRLIVYEIKELNNDIGYYYNTCSDKTYFDNPFRLRIYIKSLLEFYLYTNPSKEELDEYIDKSFDFYSDRYLAHEFIEKTLEISHRKIYSSRYFGYHFAPDYSYYDRKDKEDLISLLIKTYYYSHTDNSFLESKQKSSYEHYDSFKPEYKKIETDFSCDTLYISIERELSDISTELNNLRTSIENTISGLDNVDLYELLTYRRSFYSSHHPETHPRHILSELENIHKSFHDYIICQTKYELATRVERVSKTSIANDIAHDLIAYPSFPLPGDIETQRQLLWAWNYIILHQPDELSIEKKQESWACLHIVDVLPALANYYDKRYSSFQDRYNNTNRTKFFSDQTENYSKNKFISAKDFYATKDNPES